MNALLCQQIIINENEQKENMDALLLFFPTLRYLLDLYSCLRWMSSDTVN